MRQEDRARPPREIARHALIFFEQLGGIAALAIVLAVAFRPATEILRSLPPAAAAAATLSIIDQISFPSKKQKLPLFAGGKAARYALL